MAPLPGSYRSIMPSIIFYNTIYFLYLFVAIRIQIKTSLVNDSGRLSFLRLFSDILGFPIDELKLMVICCAFNSMKYTNNRIFFLFLIPPFLPETSRKIIYVTVNNLGWHFRGSIHYSNIENHSTPIKIKLVQSQDNRRK